MRRRINMQPEPPAQLPAAPACCANCGQPLDADGKHHYNGIVFCAFVTADIDWDNWKTARP